MILIAASIAGVWLAFLALELALYWGPLVALWRQRGVVGRLPSNAPPSTLQAPPVFAVLSACRDGAVCVPGLAKAFEEQKYPASAVHLYLVADHCTDDSAAVARRHGITVLERNDPAIPGKGNAVSDITDRLLRHRRFDYLVVLDIDARVEPDFLNRVAAHFATGADLLSFTTRAKNPNTTLLARAGDIIQALLRLHQRGRAALGLDAILYGSHGYALSRRALERLGWRTTTGQVAEDMELRLRATLSDLSIRYAPDINVYNDVTTDAASVREQRTRWNATYLPMIPRYAGLLLQKGCRGDRRALEALFGLLLLPSFANLFLYLLLSTIVFTALAWAWPSFHALAISAGILTAFDLLYFIAAFASFDTRVSGRDLSALAAHLALRTVALVESPFHVRTKDWAPAPHSEEP